MEYNIFEAIDYTQFDKRLLTKIRGILGNKKHIDMVRLSFQRGLH